MTKPERFIEIYIRGVLCRIPISKLTQIDDSLLFTKGPGHGNE